MSSASRVGAFVAVAGAVAAVLAAAPPGDATFVVLPARSGMGAAGGRGAAAGREAGVAVARGVAAGFAPVAGALGSTGLVSSAISIHQLTNSPIH